MELSEATVDELDVESVVNYAITVIGDAARFWLGANAEQKRRLQKILFPEGVTFDGAAFGTPRTCLASSYLREISQHGSSLASRTGVEPVSPP